MTTHALLSPSTAHRWTICAGSVAAVKAAVVLDEGNVYAAEGTAAHALAALCLRNGDNALAYLGRIVEDFEVDEDMAAYVQMYVDLVRGWAVDGAELRVEKPVSIEPITGEAGAMGTPDAVIINDDAQELVILDFKYGKGQVVDAEGNLQLLIYALAVQHELAFIGEYRQARLIISQPRLDRVDEWLVSTEDMQAARAQLHAQASRALKLLEAPLDVSTLQPDEKACRWCPVKGSCPALTGMVLRTVSVSIDDMPSLTAEERIAEAVETIAESAPDRLADWYRLVPLVRGWCDAVDARALEVAMEGRLPGYKLIEGRKGNRAWTDPVEAEKLLKKMRIKHDEIYEYKLISPTRAEKLAKAGIIGPRQWPALQALISRAEGKPTVAPIDDPRPGLMIHAEGLLNHDVSNLV